MEIVKPLGRPLVLAILDGWGNRNQNEGNAIAQARLPNYRQLLNNFPNTSLDASGETVGLPEGQMGNSEVGHLNMGAGRVVYQELTRITKAIKDGFFFKNEVLLEAIRSAGNRGAALHLMGLLSDGGVHSHLEHLWALLEMAKQNGLDKVYVHAFLDGRDVAPDSARGFIAAVEKKFKQLGCGAFATVMGRYYAMDRDRRWERTAKAYNAMVAGEGEKAAMALAAVEASYHQRVTDEFVQPTVIVDRQGEPVARVQQGDTVILYNFRADRARQLSRAFVDREFDGFERPGGFLGVHYVCMTQYDITISAPVAFGPQNLVHTLGEVLSEKGLRQLRIAETEKYAHVTFFFNGGVEEPNPGEDRVLVPSPKVATYNLKPEMSADEVTDRVIEAIARDVYDVIILNYANADMVGHTGIMEAAVLAVEAVDRCLGRLLEAVRSRQATLIFTSDHGNAEQMVDPETGGAYTAHTIDEVPLILVDERYRGIKLRRGSLQDIAPTMLQLLEIEKPPEMTGSSLIIDQV
ncbi:MAG: 2,3-bisphosphoglycerate-independent phosphoglycerate mutase [Bacillota bacterium]